MKNNTLKKNEKQLKPRSRIGLLDSYRLSGLPERKPLNACVTCGGRLEYDNEFQQSLKVCRKCLSLYAKIDAAFDENAKRKRRELLEKIAGGVE